MSSTPKTQPAQLYVDIPPSPFPLSGYSSLSKVTSNAVNATSGRLKENVPLRSVYVEITPSVRKRKCSEHDASTPIPAIGVKVSKKPKLNTKRNSLVPVPEAPPYFPNGFIYCHQCTRKCDKLLSIQCTVKQTLEGRKGGTIKERRCIIKFCKACLKNRYGEDIDEVKRGSKKRAKGHVENEDYIYKCPKCRDICNCARCRKEKGLEPTGNLTRAIRIAGVESAAQFLTCDPNLTALVLKKGGHTKNGKVVPSESQPKPAYPLKKQKPLPVLQWKSVATNLGLSEAQMRFQIREFTLRFASIMTPTISRAHLAELENICGSNPHSDTTEMAGWVSEGCVRSIILGVLGLLVDKDDGSMKKSIIATIKDIRSTGVNLNKIWAILVKLRHDIDGESLLSFPDPLPPPTSSTLPSDRKTRSANQSNGNIPSIHILHSAQMVPVLDALIETTLDTNAIREEIDLGVKEEKEVRRVLKECSKRENDRWLIERKRIEDSIKDQNKNQHPELKSNLEAHRQYLQRIDCALKVVLPGFAPRYTSLGQDTEGRIFWALSPGVTERKTTLDFISSVSSEAPDEVNGYRGKEKKRGRSRGAEERSSMNEWSWFVAVWGEKPPPTTIKKQKQAEQSNSRGSNPGLDLEDDEDGDEDDEKWWGFCDPQSIRDLAAWVSIKSGWDLDTNKPSSDNPSSSLVKGLQDYASLLEWRAQQDIFD